MSPTLPATDASVNGSAFTSDTAQTEQRQAPVQEPTSGTSVRSASLQSRLEQIVNDNETKGVATDASLYDLQAGRLLYAHNASTPQFAASLNKLPIALLILQDLRSGSKQLSDTVSWQSSDVRPGFGAYDQPQAPTSASLQAVLFDMLNRSGNTAVRSLVNYQLGGAQAVNDRLAALPGLQTTRLTVLDSASFYLGNTTSQESIAILQQLLASEDSYQAEIKQALATNLFSFYGVRSQLEGNDFILLANKVGMLDDIDGNNRHDVGIIYDTRTGQSYGYAFMTTAASADVVGTARAEHSLDLLGRQTLRFAGDTPGKAPKSQVDGQAASPEKRVRY